MDSKKYIHYKKRTRLKDFDYKGCYRYFITLCTFDKKAVFTDEALVSWFVDVLKEKSTSLGFGIWAYCFMPDHLHLFVEGKKDDSDLKQFIASYKQYTAFHYKKRDKKELWQMNFYDHVLRKEEDTINIANYVFNNPVRKGLVSDYKNYKFLGSFEFDVMQT
ncbi:MAG: transposase [Deltaproteobacteria bacterium]|nr:transposase [Deltaproteobacteria bacterium]